ncbi:MAG: UvrD-helicase domain-containing protein [Acutalibacteraceae bacterium]|nr:UvrD-helicase domain-containing protein [Acutalibacteraceae bacterium]
MNFTEQQNNALNAKGRVLVSAAAGSGKTAVLVERAVRLMTEGDNPVDADKLLIVTFTNAAAAEMKSRISAKLRERALEMGNIDLLRRQQYRLSVAKICTIDSFCISLVRENFYKLGIAPDFKIADNSVLLSLKNQAMTNTIDHLFSNSDDDFELLCKVLGEERADYALKNAIESVYNETCNHPFPDDYLNNLVDMYANFDAKTSPWTQIVLENAEFELQYAEKLISDCKKTLEIDKIQDSELYDKYWGSILVYEAIISTAFNACRNKDWDTLFRCCLNADFGKFSAYRGTYKDEADFIKDEAAKVRKLVKDIPKSMLMSTSEISNDCKNLTGAVRALANAVRHFKSEYEKLKKERNCVEFVDAEYMALGLLTDNHKPSETAKNLSDFYCEVMVDEYQDVNDLQNTIFELLSDNGKKLFMVGDVKQSIYRFRNAKPDIFLKNRNELPEYQEDGDKGKVIMTGNFRSAPQICDFVNDSFERLMTIETAGMAYSEDDKLIPMGNFEQSVQNRVVCDCVSFAFRETPTETPQDEKNEDAKSKQLDLILSPAQVEAQRVVDIVNETVREQPFIKTENGVRKAEYGDIAVLLRNSKYVPEIKKALDNAGIPNKCKTGGNLLDSREVLLLLSILETINNPYRDVNLVAVMMSPIFNFTADEVAQMRVENKYKSVYSVLSASVVNKEDDEHEVNSKHKTFCEKINRYRKWSKSMPIGDLLRKICADCSLFSLALSFKNGEKSRSNILAFIQIADNYDSGPDADLIGFLRYIKRAAQSDRAFNVELTDNVPNAVQIVTMHSSKGLQYPVCILAGLSLKMNKSDQTSGLLLDSEMGFGMAVCDPVKRIRYKSLPQQAIKLKKAKSQISEELCILYVAMTRAVEKLHMIVQSKSKAEQLPQHPYTVRHSKSFADFINLVSDSKNVKIIESLVKISDVASDTEIVRATPDSNDVSKIKEILEYEYPYEKLNTVSAKQTASGLAHNQATSNPIHSKPMFKKQDKISAAQKGTACHKFMECCNIEMAGDDLQAEIARLQNNGVLTQMQAKAIDLSKIKPFFESDLYTDIIKNADSLYREKNFIASLPAYEVYGDVPDVMKNEEIVIQGAADLILLKDETLYIIDYKTDRVKDGNALIEKYKLQLEIYSKAFSRIFHCKNTKNVIYSFHLGKSIFLNE